MYNGLFSVRLENILKRAGCETLEDVKEFACFRIPWKVRNMGTKATKELYTTLDIMGIYKATPDQWAALQEWEKGNPHMDEWYLTH